MESKRERTTRRTSFFQRYLIPITIVSSVVVSGTVGYFVSHFNTKESFAQAEMQSRVDDMQVESVTTIEKEVPRIINDLKEYDKDLNELVQQVDWLKQNMIPVRDGLEYINSATFVISGINNVVSHPMLSKVTTHLSTANSTLNEVDAVVFRLGHLSDIKQEMGKTRERVNQLYETYQTENDPALLLEMERELDTELVYQIEDVRTATIEAREALESSTKVILAANYANSTYQKVKNTSGKAIEKLQFWKEEKNENKIDQDEFDRIEKELADSRERLKDLPEEMAERSKETISSINEVKTELQVVRLAEVIQAD
ncbi:MULTISPECIES: hypothetical protein [unclassified Exiguobacterium]|uniref:hypothetical protein n=1 Tax=unclassified Exiguobacterium TaxID=2644629 RepID=UPI001040A210|nr:MULTISPECIES: hypothetical protein [unclassified Exiguobacterium]TCI69721.1 hypothetical protein EVJ19_08855 [Exiguobacterium sp. IPCI3]TCI79019.1 hypothetical protein EVJ18_08855 [Exiguobacterium sp. IPCH1]TCI81606.1 hypothetical protein EVJ17_08855 [Exiguobacterium sp. IPBC4]